MEEALKFYQKKSDIIHRLYVETEDMYNKRQDEILNGNYSSDVVKQHTILVMQTLNVLRENSIVSLFSLLELVLKRIYNDNNMTVREGIKKARGGQIEQSLDTLIDMWNIRNCIAHDSGNIDESKKEVEIRNIIKAMNDRYEENNFDLLGAYNDGYLCLGEGIVPHLLIMSNELLEAIKM